MKKASFAKILFLAGGLMFFAAFLFADSVKLSTYYPAPFGAYDRLKLVPRDSLPADPHCNGDKDTGTLYYDNGESALKAGIYVCQEGAEGQFGWTMIGAPVTAGKGVMSNEKIVCFRKDRTLGVCNSSPSFDGTCACQ